MLTCDTISGNSEGCHDINLSSDCRHEKLKFWVFAVVLFFGLAQENLQEYYILVF